MFGSPVLDITIGMIFIFLLVSSICTALREGLESFLKTRAAYLELGIRELLHDSKAKNIARAFFEHPQIDSLFNGSYKEKRRITKPALLARGGNLPSYIPSKNFAQALMDIAAKGPDTNLINSNPQSPVLSVENIRRNVLYIQNPQIQRLLLSASDRAAGDINSLQHQLEDWYNSSMDRVSGWYKRSTQWLLFIIGMIVAVSLNINALTLINYLSHNPTARSAIVAQAAQAVKDTGYRHMSYEEATRELNALSLPIGWHATTQPVKDTGNTKQPGSVPQNVQQSNSPLWDGFFQPFLGWLIMALAVTLGAPFWFDLLNKFMVIRSTVKPHEKSLEEGSEDRQARSNAPTIILQGPGNNPQPQPAAPIQPAMQKQAAILDNDSAKDEDSGAVAGDTVPATDLTMDENLPPAQGGVA